MDAGVVAQRRVVAGGLVDCCGVTFDRIESECVAILACGEGEYGK